MKVLKIIGIIIGILIAAILIVPLFAPATAEVVASTEIALEPWQIFPSVASFSDREEWDPWLATDSTAKVTIESKPGYVGSTYAWEGDMLGSGRMEVISVTDNEYVQSNLWFGNTDKPALIEWDFEQVDGGTQVTWTFSQKTAYPFGRLGMMIGAGMLKRSMDDGLSMLKTFLEENPPEVNPLGPISIETMDGFHAMVAKGAATMDEIGPVMGEIFGKVSAAIAQQHLEIAGPPFAHYLDYDEATGYSNFVAGFPVVEAGKDAGEVIAKTYPDMKVAEAVHTGPYDQFAESYEKLTKFVEEQDLTITGGAFEIYLVGMGDTPDPSGWQTKIAFVVE